MSDDLIRRSDAIKAMQERYFLVHDFYTATAIIRSIPSADRTQGWVDKAISIIDDMRKEGIIDYEQAREFRMRARIKGEDDE